MSKRSWIALVLTVAFGGAFVVTHQVATMAASDLQAPDFKALPLSISGWEGQEAAALDAESARILAADQYLHRYYVAPQGVVEIDVAYYSQRRVGASMHSPLNCLPGNGWTVSSSRTLAIPTGSGPVEIRELTVRRNRALFALAYWYQNRHRVLTGELATRFQLLRDSLMRKPADVGLVRVMTRLPHDTAPERQSVAAFAALLIPQLSGRWE